MVVLGCGVVCLAAVLFSAFCGVSLVSLVGIFSEGQKPSC